MVATTVSHRQIRKLGEEWDVPRHRISGTSAVDGSRNAALNCSWRRWLNMNAAHNWTIHRAVDGDLERMRVLYRDVWKYNRPPSFDLWRFFSLPEGPVPAALAVDGHKLGGSYTLWPAKLKIGSDVIKGAQSMDTMTHPDYQGQGVFTKLAEACYDIAAVDGYRVLYGFPNPLSYPGFTKRLGWTHTGDITHWIRLIKPSRHPRMPAIAKPFADSIPAFLPKGRTRGYVIDRNRPPVCQLLPLLESWNKTVGPCAVNRSIEWLDWRYSAAAKNDYRWVVASTNGKMKAMGIWGRQTSAWGKAADNRAHLVELLGDDPGALRAVLATIIGDARTGNAILLETLCNIEPICQILRKAGFYRHRRAPFIVKKLGNTPLDVEVLDHRNWRIFGGDVDTF